MNCIPMELSTKRKNEDPQRRMEITIHKAFTRNPWHRELDELNQKRLLRHSPPAPVDERVALQHLDSELIVNGIAAVECGIHTVVDQDSYKRQRKAVDVAFRYFCREFRNQVVPYDRKALSGPDQHRAYLWVDKHEYVWHHHKKVYPVIGACCFHLREYKGELPPDAPGRCYILDWVWFQPYERRRGHFSKALPYFLSRFHRLITDDPAALEAEGLLEANGLSERFPEERSLAFNKPTTGGQV
jgi:hypothetical protein